MVTRMPSTHIRRLIVLCVLACCSTLFFLVYLLTCSVERRGKRIWNSVWNYNSFPSSSTLPPSAPFFILGKKVDRTYFVFHFISLQVSISTNSFLYFFFFLGDVSPPALVALDWTHRLYIYHFLLHCPAPFFPVWSGLPFPPDFFARSPHLCPMQLSELGVETGVPLTLTRLRANASVTSLWICLNLPLENQALRQRRTTTVMTTTMMKKKVSLSHPLANISVLAMGYSSMVKGSSDWGRR